MHLVSGAPGVSHIWHTPAGPMRTRIYQPTGTVICYLPNDGGLCRIPTDGVCGLCMSALCEHAQAALAHREEERHA